MGGDNEQSSTVQNAANTAKAMRSAQRGARASATHTLPHAHPVAQFQPHVWEGTQLALAGLSAAFSHGMQKEEERAPPPEYRPAGQGEQRRT